MKLRAEPIQFSSVVGGGLMLINEANRVCFQIAFMGASDHIDREISDALAQRIGGLINEHGLVLDDET